MNTSFSKRANSRRVFAALTVAAGTFTTLVPTLTSAWAAPQGTSLATGLATSKGGAALNDSALSGQLGEFFKTFATEFKLPAPQSSKAQLFWWSSENYKAGRASFWGAGLQKSLENEGYLYKDLDNHQVTTNIYDERFGLSSYDETTANRRFKLSTGDQFRFFIATHEETGQTLVGLWVDQQEDNKCLFAFAPLGDQAIKKSAPLPSVGGGNVLLVKDFSDVMKGIAPPKNPVFAPRAKKRGYASGQVKDTNGRPLAGATIYVSSSAAGGFRTSVTAKTNAQGIYEVALPVGICQVVDAFQRVVYNGKPYFLPLRAVDGNRDTFNSANGHVENFVLRTWGVANVDGAATEPKEGAYYFGAPIRAQWFHDGLPETGTIQVMLKPQGALLGGGVGHTFIFRMPVKGDGVLMSDYYFNDIPIGRYVMTAQVIDDGEELPLKIEKVFTNDPLAESIVVDFKNFSNEYASQDRCGLALFNVAFKA
ncbi:carboxypeptidase regulatory-like domain-containing protein [bacterium]|nr:MAG: carboxypeptidase regulatory-like domain-containing protein [bacterium]